jgi:AcrR family transcriptional regulator
MLVCNVKSVSEDWVNCQNGGLAKGRLSRDLICETALKAIDEVGLEEVSMRMLASALGVKASSLYYHFGSRDELMTEVAEFLYRRLGQPPSGDDWAEQVKGTFVQLRDFIQVHPNAAPLLVRDLARSPVAKKRANVLLKLVCRTGMDPVASATLLSNLVALLVGHTLLALWMKEETGATAEVGGGHAGDGDVSRVWVHRLFPADYADLVDSETTPVADEWSSEELATGVGRSTPQRTVEGLAAASVMSSPPAQWPGESVFSSGLDALISGFALNRD